MSEHTSERTPESNGPRAIKDIQPEHGALVRPNGPPTTLGPQAQVNPFWSETQRDEAILRACRPSHLPREIPEVAPPSTTAVSPPREAPDAVRLMFHGLLQENARLWSEREVAGPGGWGQHVMPFGSQQSMLGGVLGEPQGRDVLGALMDIMKPSWGSSFSQSDKGLLGALSMPVDLGGGWMSSRPEQGFFGGSTQAHRGNLQVQLCFNWSFFQAYATTWKF